MTINNDNEDDKDDDEDEDYNHDNDDNNKDDNDSNNDSKKKYKINHHNNYFLALFTNVNSSKPNCTMCKLTSFSIDRPKIQNSGSDILLLFQKSKFARSSC